MRERSFDLASARRAADHGETALWVGDFLASRGSDNEVLASALAQREHWWVGPISLSLDALTRLAGPEDDVLCQVADDDWEDDISEMEESVERGWEPPPLLAEFQDGRLLLQDGNHRYEALVRSGARSAWVLIYFDNRTEWEAFSRQRSYGA
jgi:hypothetical protein